jgi:hypothetical protein
MKRKYLDGFRQIAVSHYGIQNGNLMRDPEVVFVLACINR